ncbi:uncharacterized protein GLRG_00838 [Colletotrichum graminicola M1.001]|uniref:Uncharacterized protein n=1 Tax=Colletotrichum graminicola (strain M1.001 / M2 / FGSC 10212) TaxID=645133 RepID=E3Q3U2_COLGM|nr:uncharacterized protein GLRG_00838 [Colletotrichum graminicola M1.001]EFQ25694.1 hypothetical protein GLRG_00838 [Colletotrichum graminicola M1.001]
MLARAVFDNSLADIATKLDVAAVARAEAEAWPAEYVRQLSSARNWDVNDDASAAAAPDQAFRESRLETFTRFRVGVSQDAGTYRDLLLVDVEDREGPNVSREVRHEGFFESVVEVGDGDGVV